MIKPEMVKQRLKRKSTFIIGSSGLWSLLRPIEPNIVNTIIQIARIRESIRPSTGVILVNSIIKGTPVQDELIRWKRWTGSYNTDGLGEVGRGYLKKCMKRKKDKIFSKKGKERELDRASFSTYANIAQMYGGVIDEFIDANVSVRMADYVWMDKDRLECEKE